MSQREGIRRTDIRRTDIRRTDIRRTGVRRTGVRRKGAFRLQWFLPTLRKRRSDREDPRTLLPVGIARRVLPQSWFSDMDRGRAGTVRKFLRRLGPSVVASPVRRASQAICFLLFLYLFFYVCWPYDAQPLTSQNQSPQWTLTELRDDGAVTWQHESIPKWLRTKSLQADGDLVYVIDGSAASDRDGELGGFSIENIAEDTVTMRPSGVLSPTQFNRMLMTAGPWTLAESSPTAWPSHYADNLSNKERLPAELFLAIDPLVSLSTAVASRQWVWSLGCAAILLAICIVVPRGFCGYLCPLGTLIDLFDWSIGSRVTRFRVAPDGWWVHVKYYLLLGTMLCALFGVLVSGYFAAIPVITRGMLLFGDPLQIAGTRGLHQIPSLHFGHLVSIVLFLGVFALGFLQPRFWCKYVCPSGAVFSLGNLFRVTQRKVESSCIHCDKCIEVCPFDAIKPDFTTRTTDCTFCQTCGGVCPVHAIKFVPRGDVFELKLANDPPTGETAIGRRGFLSLAAGTSAAAIGTGIVKKTMGVSGADLDDPAFPRPVRPPGSVPEAEFLEMCIRCGECFKACPNHVLQLEGFQQGWAGLWTPMVNADWAGCESSCNACGQVCPTGAIRALPMEEKRYARMGLAVVNELTCLPMAGIEACQLCVDECVSAGYEAIEFHQVHTQVDEFGVPIEGSGFLAPVVLADKCVGCGLCQTRCNVINVKQSGSLQGSAIVIEVGDGKEDRMITGSYRERRLERRQREQSGNGIPSDIDAPFVIDAPFGVDAPTDIDNLPTKEDSQESSSQPEPIDLDDPFGLGANSN
ncbi:putative electron transport protein YccM [Planctomycetes bacterium CA13]|uniref:Putative electron transport protein YccM n=1 Tax=Novipirellula herctigrandis TaxID=2527986 RepID=A0A5C5YNF7_9BACT|nr:putative electron transport protein YccM [Planctomycetes bacterium CA13]